MKILANDGIHLSGIKYLEEAGHQVDTTTVSQSQLAHYINEQQIEVVLVRSATEIKEDIIDQCQSIRSHWKRRCWHGQYCCRLRFI
jgi:D-3-phosphoglycerate dehydrogenase